ncbi:MAG: glutamate racemase [Pseudomonadota bacterium]
MNPQQPSTHSDAPIGILDSGAGGLSVLRQIRTLLPHEPLLYAADSAHIPYGDKSPAFVRQRVEQIADSLTALGAKALVVACNTATAAAVEALRRRHALPVVGMEPGVKPALLNSRSGVVGILATAGMAGSRRLQDLVTRYGGESEVIVQACPGLVEQVERHALNTPQTAQLLERYLQPILERRADTLVLGCTHYPFLQPLIRRLCGEGVAIIDTGEAVARRLQQQLAQHQLLRQGSDEAGAHYYTSAEPAAQSALFSRLLEQPVTVERLPEPQPDRDNRTA